MAGKLLFVITAISIHSCVFLKPYLFKLFYSSAISYPQQNGKHTVFGKVTQGMNVVRLMEQVGNPNGTPKKKVEVTDSGSL